MEIAVDLELLRKVTDVLWDINKGHIKRTDFRVVSTYNELSAAMQKGKVK